MKKKLMIGIIILSLLILGLGVLVYNGIVRFNIPNNKRYPVKGIDVSNHQGEIVWRNVKKENIEFAYIKASEGKDFKDKLFKKNWKESKKNGIKTGAYHFLTFNSKGIEQAENFISIVPIDKNSMPPVVDIEFGGNSKKIPNKISFKKEIKDFIREVEKKYKKKPILYITNKSYKQYIEGDFKGYHVWIRDIFKSPKFDKGRGWLLWQYCNRGRRNGIKSYVDLNVFNGSKQEFIRVFGF